ncbi:MAG: indolepyruvate ferredoxin oxidoreductase family protein [Rhodothalassiaceae bacterium]
MELRPVTLDDKYLLEKGRAYMTGIQALVRLPIVQRRRDAEAGLRTAGFISGYRGSPLGTYDQELMRAQRYLAPLDITFVPGLNEDLAATAVWGSQQANLAGRGKYDGVFGIWYGKGPGVDRSMDVFKHANAAGTMPHGGVLAIAGDDHGAKSSTLPHQTEHDFMAAMMPVLYPAGVSEFVEYGLLGIAMSRFTGAWVAFKTTSDTAETSASVDLAAERRRIVMPEDFEMPPGGLHIRWPDPWRGQDTRLQRYKGFAAHAFARANGIDGMFWHGPRDRLGIIASGKAWLDVRQALHELGITEEVARDIGLRLYKVGMVWPLEPEGARRFAEGLEEVLVVEEKREMIEYQLMQQLYNWKENARPRIVGKYDETGKWLLPPDNELDISLVAHAIASRLARIHDSRQIRDRLAFFESRKAALETYEPEVARTPYFCSGCPHNSSTRLPEGSRALAGIGCHIMAINMDRHNETFTQMGGEGVPWIGTAPFTEERHIFANLGDGTYTHSGLLAIRAAVAAKVNITYKILYNDAVAMTGGQEAEGHLSVPQIAAQLVAEGVGRVVVLSERVEAYRGTRLPEGVDLLPREHLMRIQKEFREIPGVTAIIYDQTCAAEKRRRRKRGKMEDPNRRVFINARVCEGCGDCSVQSNCVSVEPLETEFGRKRRINQSSCNKDFSCLKGFCPSFVTIEGADVRRPAAGKGEAALPVLPEPRIAAISDSWNILVTGIGGTGVLTIGALLGMAAHLEGKGCSVLDMAGLAQKGGAVLSHIRLFPDADRSVSPKIIAGATDLLLACDLVVAAGKEAQMTLSPDRSHAVMNSAVSPTADFVRMRDFDFREKSLLARISSMTRADGQHVIDATDIATALMGDAIATNIFLLGYAWQKGLIPLGRAAIEEAIRLNKVAIESNLRTFHWGRAAAHDPASVLSLIAPAEGGIRPSGPRNLDQLVARRGEDLVAYGTARLARRYLERIRRIREAEAALGLKTDALTQAVAVNYYKLLAYKDEYEVARLYTDPEFKAALKAQFEDGGKISVLLSPPLLARRDPLTGRPAKIKFGPWIFGVFAILARLKFLRGTPFDPFGLTAERRKERALIRSYEAHLDEIETHLTRDCHDAAVALARLPEEIRGYGPIKEEAIRRAEAREEALLRAFREPQAATVAAE